MSWWTPAGWSAAASREPERGAARATDRRSLLLGLILACAGGYADASSYLLSGSFTGHVTGNAVLMAIALAGGRGAQALSCLLAVGGFLIGTAIGLVWPRLVGGGGCRRLAWPLAAETAPIAAGLCVIWLRLPVSRALFLACVCLALGVQNGILNRLGAASVRTTFITGMSTSLIGALLLGADGVERRVLSAVIAGFLCGASCGALIVSRAGVAGVAGLITLLALAWLLCITAPRRKDGWHSRRMAGMFVRHERHDRRRTRTEERSRQAMMRQQKTVRAETMKQDDEDAHFLWIVGREPFDG